MITSSQQLWCSHCSSSAAHVLEHTICTRIGRGFFVARCTSCKMYAVFRNRDNVVVFMQLAAPSYPSVKLRCGGCKSTRLLLECVRIPTGQGLLIRALCSCGQEGLYEQATGRFITAVRVGLPLPDTQKHDAYR